MYPRVEYEMSESDLEMILNACQSVPLIMVGGYTPRSAQERANDAWSILGKKMGFDYLTVQPIASKGNRFFTAVPSESETARAERLAIEAEEKRQAEIEKLTAEIDAAQKRLDELSA